MSPTQPAPFGCRYLAIVIVSAFLFGSLGAVFGNTVSDKAKTVVSSSPGTQTTIGENKAVIAAVKKVSPAVVSISSTTETATFFGPVEEKGGGTGFIITSDGLIATNRHVVEGRPSELTVLTNDGKTFRAQVKSLDPTEDFAIIKINARNLPVVDLGDSDSLQVGEGVIAIGNALGEFQNTVTTGVISARERSLEATDQRGETSEQLENLLQTDAAINLGNSGGPLVNLAGQVIGVNTAVAQQSQGIGFALPINVVKSAITSYQQKGKIIRASLGVRFRTITPDYAKLAKLPVDTGALLVSGPGSPAVIPGSAAAKAGLRSGDIITSVDGTKIDDDHSLPGILGKHVPGDTVDIIYLRGGKETKVKIVLDERG